MKVKTIKKDKEKSIYQVEGVKPGYINTLRRTMSSEVPVMAISEVEFKKNTSALYDEVLAHRMGMLSISTDLKGYNMPEEGAEKSSATHVTLTLKAKGPKVVYASELTSKDPNVKPVHGKTPIVNLAEGQELELSADACLGIGKNHSKWASGLITHNYKPKITVNNNSSKLKEYIDKYPKEAIKNGKIDEKALENNPRLIDACEGINEDIVKVEYEEENKDFLLEVESWGQLNPDEIVKKGVEVFDERLEEFNEALKKVK